MQPARKALLELRAPLDHQVHQEQPALWAKEVPLELGVRLALPELRVPRACRARSDLKGLPGRKGKQGLLAQRDPQARKAQLGIQVPLEPPERLGRRGQQDRPGLRVPPVHRELEWASPGW